jgi:hypothetical protein
LNLLYPWISFHVLVNPPLRAENPRVPSSILGPATPDFKGLAQMELTFFISKRNLSQPYPTPQNYFTCFIGRRSTKNCTEG